MYDIVIATVPYSNIEVIPLGPAVLKGIAEYEGFKVKTLDLGMELFKQCEYNKPYFEHLETYYIENEYALTNDELDILDTFVSKWAQELVSMDTVHLGISVFSYYGHLFAIDLLTKIKQLDATKQIVVGGPGVGTRPTSILDKKYSITQLEKLIDFGKLLKKRGLADAIIYGDGEEALVEFLKGNDKLTEQRQAMDYKVELPFADFDDYDICKYPGQLGKNYPQLPIFSSKGCVRKCDFCDVEAVQGKFRFRTGPNIAKEMLFLADKYQIRDFNFQDSLVNGSLKTFCEWVTIIADYNNNNPDKHITWNGSWISRPQGQMPEHIYELMAQSGCESLTIGLETGSDALLKAMNKKTDSGGAYYEFDLFQKHKIKFIGLMIIGHWDEHWEDFLYTCDMFYRMIPYARSGVLIGISLGSTAKLYDGTPADAVKGLDVMDMDIWYNHNNPDLVAKERFFRWVLAQELCKDLKIPILSNTWPYVHTSIKRMYDKFKEFYNERTKGLTLSNTAEQAYDKYNDFYNLILSRHVKNEINIEIHVRASVIEIKPKFMIKYNDDYLANDDINDGINVYKFTVPVDNVTANKFSMQFYHKRQTLIDDNGNITKDTFAVIEKFIVDGIDILADPEYFYKELQYIEFDQPIAEAKHGFWIERATLILEFTNFMLEYNLKSNMNVEYSAKMIDSSSMAEDYYVISNEEYRDKIVDLLKTL